MAESMKKIDSHQHFWHYDPAQYPWISEQMKVIQRDFLPKDLQQEIRSVGISSVISVQARQGIEETRWLLSFATELDWIVGVVGWAPLIAPAVSEVLAEMAQNRKLRAIRHVLHDEDDPQYMLRPDFNNGVRELKSLGLAYDILIFEKHLPQTIEFVDRHPNQVFIMDHLAKPRVRDNEISPWKERLQELAQRPHVFCKISGLATEADYGRWTPEQLHTYIAAVLEIFGPDRLMFGSDWPVCLLAIEYSQWASMVAEAIADLSESEQQRIWSGTATEAYRLQS